MRTGELCLVHREGQKLTGVLLFLIIFQSSVPLIPLFMGSLVRSQSGPTTSAIIGILGRNSDLDLYGSRIYLAHTSYNRRLVASSTRCTRLLASSLRSNTWILGHSDRSIEHAYRQSMPDNYGIGLGGMMGGMGGGMGINNMPGGQMLLYGRGMGYGVR